MIKPIRFNPQDLLTQPLIDSHALAIQELQAIIGGLMPDHRDVEQAMVYVKNDTGSDLTKGAIVGLGDPIYSDPTGDEAMFLHGELAFTGETPSETGGHEGKFAVLDQAIGNGNVGVACIQGVVRVKVIFATGTEKWADITDGSTATLTAAATGSARILWREGTGAGTVWCACLVGCGVSGGGVAGVIPVKVTMDGGEGGSASTDCSYTYSVDDENGNKIAEDMTPQTPRLLYTQYTAGDGWGWGCYDKDDNFILLDAGEKEVAEVIT